jgi:DNA polymerase III subunit chi
MAEIGFYHLTRTPLERALPQLLEKIHGSGARAVVMAGSDERVDALNAALWTYDPASFLPHGAARDGNEAAQPIWLTATDENPNQSKFLVLTDGASSDHVGDYERCFEMFDGHDDQALAAARTSWKIYRDAGHELTYWQQTETGGWQKKDA